MNTRASDNEQAEYVREYLQRRKDVRWLFFWGVGLGIAGLLLIGLSVAHAGGTVTDSKYIWLQRSGVTLTDKTTPVLACTPPKTMLECAACMISMIDAERKSRTTGYVTYRCLDVSQSYVKFNATPFPPVVTPPVASLQVYTCADAGADGRILESDTVIWPNCTSTSYKAPSKALVVAVNTGTRPLYWRLASKVTDGRVWTQTGTVGDWTSVGAIDWGASVPPSNGAATISWTPPTQNTDGTSLTNLAGYKVLYGPSPTTLVQTQQVPAGVSSAVVENLTAGTWYFAVKAYNTAGIESVNSNVASKTLP